MKFGWMTLSLSPSAADDLACVHQQLEQGVLAETMGFDYLWLTEHNFTGECAYADPIPFAGALAARTSRARLGFAVVQMALHHPVRLAIQLAVLDNLSRGRLEVGIGRGSTYNEYEYDSHDRMEEAVEVLTTQRRLLDAASVWRFLYVADSDAQAEDDVQAATLHYRQHMHHVREAYNPPDFRVNAAAMNPRMDPAVSHADGVRFVLETGALYGTPKRVAEQIAALRETGLGHVMCQTSWGGLAHDKVMASLRLFGGRVAPLFR